ncbi:hypothetical protein BDR06DRAFT_966777 [Suillus hirtellus]|nr:hypothetical protein BDR06DRAFT_966777 [Suillus hirtellus]
MCIPPANYLLSCSYENCNAPLQDSNHASKHCHEYHTALGPVVIGGTMYNMMHSLPPPPQGDIDAATNTGTSTTVGHDEKASAGSAHVFEPLYQEHNTQQAMSVPPATMLLEQEKRAHCVTLNAGEDYISCSALLDSVGICPPIQLISPPRNAILCQSSQDCIYAICDKATMQKHAKNVHPQIRRTYFMVDPNTSYQNKDLEKVLNNTFSPSLYVPLVKAIQMLKEKHSLVECHDIFSTLKELMQAHMDMAATILEGNPHKLTLAKALLHGSQVTDKFFSKRLSDLESKWIIPQSSVFSSILHRNMPWSPFWHI